jgi:hypothetical protein
VVFVGWNARLTADRSRVWSGDVAVSDFRFPALVTVVQAMEVDELNVATSGSESMEI